MTHKSGHTIQQFDLVQDKVLKDADHRAQSREQEDQLRGATDQQAIKVREHECDRKEMSELLGISCTFEEILGKDDRDQGCEDEGQNKRVIAGPAEKKPAAGKALPSQARVAQPRKTPDRNTETRVAATASNRQ